MKFFLGIKCIGLHPVYNSHEKLIYNETNTHKLSTKKTAMVQILNTTIGKKAINFLGYINSLDMIFCMYWDWGAHNRYSGTHAHQCTAHTTLLPSNSWDCWCSCHWIVWPEWADLVTFNNHSYWQTKVHLFVVKHRWTKFFKKRFSLQGPSLTHCRLLQPWGRASCLFGVGTAVGSKEISYLSISPSTWPKIPISGEIPGDAVSRELQFKKWGEAPSYCTDTCGLVTLGIQNKVLHSESDPGYLCTVHSPVGISRGICGKGETSKWVHAGS